MTTKFKKSFSPMLICWNDIKIHLGFEDSYFVPPPITHQGLLFKMWILAILQHPQMHHQFKRQRQRRLTDFEKKTGAWRNNWNKFWVCSLTGIPNMMMMMSKMPMGGIKIGAKIMTEKVDQTVTGLAQSRDLFESDDEDNLKRSQYCVCNNIICDCDENPDSKSLLDNCWVEN